MLKWLRDRLIQRRRERLDCLDKLARQADELIAYGRLCPATRQQLQAARQRLQRRAQKLAPMSILNTRIPETSDASTALALDRSPPR
jgi:hypothetical protein